MKKIKKDLVLGEGNKEKIKKIKELLSKLFEKEDELFNRIRETRNDG